MLKLLHAEWPARYQRGRLALLVAAVIAGVLPSVSPLSVGAATTYQDCAATSPSPAGTAPCDFAGFEMDGNTAVDTTLPGGGAAIDWATTPFPYTRSDFNDLFSSTSDNGFVQGSDYLNQAGWVCDTHKSTPKVDLVDGSVAFGNITVGGQTHQIGYFKFTRVTGNGVAFVDFAFSKGTTSGPHASATCTGLPARQVGDVVVTFEFLNGGGVDVVDAATWNGAGFTSLPTGSLGTNFVAAFNTDGTFGEGALDMTGSGVGNFSCHQFGTVYMDSHASGASVQNEMKDYIVPTLPPLCQTATVATQSTPNSGTVALGTAASDSAVVTGVAGYSNPTGTVSFHLCGPAASGLANTASATTGCTGGTLISTTTTSTPGTNGLGAPTATYASGSFTNTIAPGLYCWRANYTAGNTTDYGNVATSETSETSECFTVVKASPDIVTTPSASTVLEGTPISDTARVGGVTPMYFNSLVPLGTVTFSLLGPFTSASQVSCGAGAPVVTVIGPQTASSAVFGGNGYGYADYQTGNVTAPAGDFWYAWKAVYSGNSLNNDATGDCTLEEVHVTAPLTTIKKQEKDLTTGGSFVDGPISANPGDTIEYQMVATNNGNGNATNVTIGDLVPTSHVTSVICLTPSCVYNAASGTITYNAGTVAPGASATLDFTITLDPVFPVGTTTIDNTATVITDQEPQRPSNQVVANVVAAPIQGLAKAERDVTTGGTFSAGPITANPGDVLEYQLVYSNTGNAAATGVTVSDSLPARTTFVSCTATCTHNATSVSWALGTVAPGTVTLTFQVQLDSLFPAGTTPVDNTAVSTSGQGGVNSNQVVANVNAAPVQALHKQERDVTAGGTFSNGPISANPGDTLEYQLAYSNTGNAAATSVVVSDALPGRTTFVSCSNACTHSATGVSWNLGSVNPGTVTRTFMVKLDATFPAGSTTVDNAAVSTSGQGNVNSNTVVANVTADPVTALAKAERDVTSGGTFSSGPITANPGDTLEYRLTYRNTGNAAATSVTVNDPLPGHTTFVSCTGGCTTTATSVSWSLGTVAPGSVAVTFQVKLDAVFAAGTTTVDNAAVAQAAQATVDSNTVVATVTVAPASGQLGVQITLPHAGANAGNGIGGSRLPITALAGLALLILAMSGALGAGLVLRRRS